MILSYAFVFKYGDGKVTIGSHTYDDGGIAFYYPMYQDVHVMIFVGFGFLMSFLKSAGFQAIGFNFLVAAFTIEWSLLMNGVFEHAWLKEHGDVPLNITSLIFADFAAGAVLITFGGIVGKVSSFQLCVIALLEIVFYNVNEKLGLITFATADVGGSMFVHTFGAYFGLAFSFVLSRMNWDDIKDNPDNSSNKASDTFAMIGTLFLWMFWPSFNGAMAQQEQKHRVVVNTVISLAACCVSAFAASSFFRNKKFSMVDIQNASLAGGVAIGSSADLIIEPWAAALIGTLAAVLSVVGYTKVSPLLEKYLKIHDTCGIHNLHGMPGVMGALGGVFAALAATEDKYGKSTITTIWGARGSPDNRTAGEQAGYQMAALACTLAISIIGGLITGCVAAFIQKMEREEGDEQMRYLPNGMKRSKSFSDADFEGGEETVGGMGA